MGNCSCIDHSAVVSWADDDWDEWDLTSAGAASPGKPAQHLQRLKEGLLRGSPRRAEDAHHHDDPEPLTSAETTSAAGDTHEVKIKISKRQLQKLVGKAAGEGVEGLRQALERLLGSGGWDWEKVAREAAKWEDAGHGHLHWRPNLQSIPEGAE